MNIIIDFCGGLIVVAIFIRGVFAFYGDLKRRYVTVVNIVNNK